MTAEHRVRWHGVLPDGERVPRNQHMNGGDWGWDAECSCGWGSRTGGAIQERVREAIADHRADVAWNAAHPTPSSSLRACSPSTSPSTDSRRSGLRG